MDKVVSFLFFFVCTIFAIKAFAVAIRSLTDELMGKEFDKMLQLWLDGKLTDYEYKVLSELKERCSRALTRIRFVGFIAFSASLDRGGVELTPHNYFADFSDEARVIAEEYYGQLLDYVRVYMVMTSFFLIPVLIAGCVLLAKTFVDEKLPKLLRACSDWLPAGVTVPAVCSVVILAVAQQCTHKSMQLFRCDDPVQFENRVAALGGSPTEC